MGAPLRILIAGASNADAVDLEARVAACGFAAVHVKRTPAAGAAAELHGGADWDLLLAGYAGDRGALADALETADAGPGRIPVVLLAPELTEEVALLAHRFGAKVCLAAHGAAPLRQAILRAAREAAERRESAGGDDAGERVRALVHQSVSDVVLHLSVEGEDFRFVEINPAFTRATGLAAEQVVGKLVTQVIPEPSLSLVLAHYREAITERRTVRWEEITEYPTGTKYGEVSVTPVLDARGRCTRLVGTVQDVTDLARVRALGAAERRLLEMAAAGCPLDETLGAYTRAVEHELAPAKASVRVRSIDGTEPLAAAEPEGARRACWSAPITASSGRVLGSFTLEHPAPRAPAPADLELVARCAHLASIAVQRHELDEQLRELPAHIDAAREEERTGIAREIHDQLGQALTVLKMDLAWIARRASSADGLSREALLEKVAGLVQTADETIQEVRRISAELRPAILDNVGLGAALAWKAQEVEQRTHLACAVHSTLAEDAQLDRGLATTVFRVFQEALTNVVRHADATRVSVSLDESDGFLVLQVRDDGRGITPAEIEDPRSLGLVGIRERARRLGGTVAITRAAPHGTIVTLRVRRPAAA
ncbi:MAG TPA: PAS domain-containing sensor histidine kinase [Polyangia bacterium]